MTYPLIGNYGVCLEDIESEKPWHSAFIVREISRTSSNFRREEDLEDYLKEHDIPGICGVDTRAITKILREHGCMGGMITTNPDFNLDEILPKLKEYTVTDAVKTVSRTEKEHFDGDGFKVALLDLGTKNNIIRSLEKRADDSEKLSRDSMINTNNTQRNIFISAGLAIFGALVSLFINLL